MNDSEERVVIVDPQDRALGVAGKLDVHVDGTLHRAFSVFGFNARGEILVQKRAGSKYHSAGLWANTCCGHPRPGEDVGKAAARRTFEELGVFPELTPAFQSHYKADVGNRLTEHEYVHAFSCRIDALPCPNPIEASDVQFIAVEKIAGDITQHPDRYAAWFRLYFAKHLADIQAIRVAQMETVQGGHQDIQAAS